MEIMADSDCDEGAIYEADEDNGGFYKRFSLSDSKANSLSFLLPSSGDHDELIYDVKQPSLSSINLTDSVCSNSTISSTGNGYKFNQDPQEAIGSGLSANNILCDGVTTIVHDSPHDSEPEDMQDYKFIKSNKNLLNRSDIMTKQLLNNNNNNNKCVKQNLVSNNITDPLWIDYNQLTSTPTSSFCMNKKNMSISLQDVSMIDIFPLESKTNNAFSTETIQTQSMSSTIKSKDSGFQRSASCLSLNSGNRSYDHVQSKVKQYIKDIKEAEAQRKKQKRLQIGNSFDVPKSSKSNHFVTNMLDTSSDIPQDMMKMIDVLKNEIKERDTILNELQQNYNLLLERYAEAVNQIDLLRLRSSFNYDYHSDHNSDGSANNYCNKRNSLPLVDSCNRDASQRINNANNSLSSIEYNLSPQHVLFPESTIDNNNYIDASVLAIVPRRTPVLQTRSSDKNDTSLSSNVCNKYTNVSVTKNNNVNNNNASNTLSANRRAEDDSWKRSLTETQQTYSGSYSTSLNTANSVKSVALRPISRMYSSSSRLDRKVPPLPSASSSLSQVFKSNNSKNRSSNVVKKHVEFNNKLSNNSFDSNSNTYSLGNDSNSKGGYCKSANGTLVGDDMGMPYLNCQSISKLELPKVDPFDKVKKWQASLPTISLVRSQSSSSIGSVENTEMKPYPCRCSSLDSKLDNDNIYHTFLNSQPENMKSKLKSKVKLNFDDHSDSLCVFAKHDQKLFSLPKYPRIYFDFYDTNKLSSNELDSKNQSDRTRRTRSSKNILRRSDALDVNNEESIKSHHHDKNERVLDDRNVDSLPFISNIEEDERYPSVADESSSMSSSILSSTKDRSASKMKFSNVSTMNNKNISNQEVIDNKASYSYVPSETKVNFVCKTHDGINKELGTNKKRVGFSLLAQFQMKSSETEFHDSPVLQKTYAWGSPKHETDAALSDSTLQKAANDFSVQRTSDLKASESVETNGRSVLQHQQKRKEQLRRYTEILSNRKGLDADTLRSCVSVGVQVSDEFSESRMSDLVNRKSAVPPSERTYNENLEDAEECVNYVVKEMARICGHLEKLQTHYFSTVKKEHSS